MHRYDGNATYLNATSNTVNVNVTKMSTALTLTASNRTPVVNQQVTFNATLSSGTTLSQERSLSVVPSSLFLFRFQGPERIECCLSLPVSNRSLYYPLTFFRPTNVRVMRVYKTVSFSVVILLIAVLFAGVATVPAAAQYRYDAVPLQRPAHRRLQPRGGVCSAKHPVEVDLHNQWRGGILPRHCKRRRLRWER